MNAVDGNEEEHGETEHEHLGCWPEPKMLMQPRADFPPEYTDGEFLLAGWIHLPRGHDWFAIFYDLIFVAVCFKLGVDLKENVGLYGCIVTAGLVVPLWSTWLKSVMYANRFSNH